MDWGIDGVKSLPKLKMAILLRKHTGTLIKYPIKIVWVDTCPTRTLAIPIRAAIILTFPIFVAHQLIAFWNSGLEQYLSHFS